MKARVDRSAWRAATALVLVLIALGAQAHKASDSYLTLDLTADAPRLRWDIALRDLEYAIGLDGDGDGAITWGELRARHGAIADHALSRLRIVRSGVRCSFGTPLQRVENHGDGAYTVLELGLRCPRGAAVSIDYGLFFDLDPLHRGLLQVRGARGAHAYVLSPQAPRVEIEDLGSPGLWRQFQDYWREGVWHIWIGFDHLLFLFTLLLPAVLRREAGTWHPVSAFLPALRDMVCVITAFTVAHSATLAVAVLGAVSLPSRPVEAAIAATVVLAALNNLYPLVRARRWAIAFVLGLVHGFGFASVLSELGLPEGALALALAGFNLGVECGQLAVAVAFIPLAYRWRGTWLYRRGVFGFGSVAAAGIGLVWFAQRSFDLTLPSL